MADISVEANLRNPLVSVGSKGACTCPFCEALRKNMAQGRWSRAPLAAGKE
jgi:hypothetical protein